MYLFIVADEELFEQYITDNSASEGQKSVFCIIQEELQIVPMEHPFSYIKKLQKSFDYDKLIFSKEYQQDLEEIMPKESTPPEWKVAYEEGFFSKRGRAGKEVRVEKAFTWGKETWHVPAVYLCNKGLVIEFCVELESDCVKSFFEKWQLLSRSYIEHTEEEQEQIRQEHPLNIGFQAEIGVNQVNMNQTYSYGMSWISPNCIPMKQREKCYVCEENSDTELEDSFLAQAFELGASLEAKWLLEHYGYDTNRTWAIQRVGFQWKEKRPRAIKSLILKLERDRVNVYGTSFFIEKRNRRTIMKEQIKDMKKINGGNRYEETSIRQEDSFDEIKEKKDIVVIHPNSGQKYLLKIREYDKQELKREDFYSEDMEYPTYFHAMTYTIYPEYNDFYITDCKQGDSPRPKGENSDGPIGIGAVGVLGLPRKEDREKYFHTDGTVARTRVACSSVYFEPVDEVEWKIVFHEKQMSDVEVRLL